MSYPKKALIIVFCISVFLFIYLQHVRSERAETINKFFNAPQVGDVYKVKFRNTQGERWVRYYKVADMNENTVFFYRGKLVAWGITDVLLDHYETENLLSYSKDDLNKIRHGKFSNGEMYGAELLEITRQ